MDWQTDEKALHAAVDLMLGEEKAVELTDGSTATVKLQKLVETRDDLHDAVRRAVVTVQVNGTPVDLVSGTYRLPVTAGGIQIDCPVTGGYVPNSRRNAWAMECDARLRLWPAGSPWITPGTFVYPIRQRWFASQTQMGNEPVFVDGPENPARKDIYYHEGLDFGGAEGLVESVAASDALVVSCGDQMLPGYEDTPAETRYDVVYLLDRRGWYHRHSHLKSIDPALKLGETVTMGQVVGLLGKEGHSGGWSHLHYGISCPQPSGRYGAAYGYPFIWQAYRAEHSPKLIAVARPHHFIWSGDGVTLDASMSWSAEGLPLRFEWTFSDGSTATGAKVKRTYPRPGVYSEVVKVTDAVGRVEYEFAVVQVANREDPAQGPSGIHAAYAPTLALHPGREITFKVRSFRTQHGEEVWDFGDGSATVAVRSDGNADVHNPDGYAVTAHSFAEPGDYLVSVRRTNERGFESVDRLHVRIEPD
ncbi:MAG: PKD domain-containing protein [Candidatus Brocadiaceae bacterium]|nr:PKD domain-containing protein [Candidatus Brocadiaceae bacterium]